MTIKWTTEAKIAGEGLEIRNDNIIQAERNVLRDEARESYLSIKVAVKGNPAAEQWLAQNKHLWKN